MGKEELRKMHKAYPTGLEGKTDYGLELMAQSLDTPHLQHIIIAEEMKRRREVKDA